MDNREFQRLVSDLSQTLTKKQMTDMRRQLAMLIGDRSDGQQADWVLDGIKEVLREHGLGAAIPPNFTIRNRSKASYAGYETQADRVRQLLSEAVPDMSYTETKTMGVIAARCLADYIKSWSSGNELSLDRMLNNVGLIPVAIERAFPGYIDAGVLGFLLRSKREYKVNL